MVARRLFGSTEVPHAAPGHTVDDEGTRLLRQAKEEYREVLGEIRESVAMNVAAIRALARLTRAVRIAQSRATEGRPQHGGGGPLSPRKKRARHVGCSIAPSSDGERLTLRFRFGGRRHREETGLANTPQNRRLLRPKADLIGAELRAGTFVYERWFPRGEATAPPAPRETVRSRYESWIAEKRAAVGEDEHSVKRAGNLTNYEADFRNYILPVLGDAPLEDFRDPERALRWLRKAQAAIRTRQTRRRRSGSEPMGEGKPAPRQLSEKTVRNALDGSLRALVRDSLGDAGTVAFRKLEWGASPNDTARPFSADERDRLLDYFASKLWQLPPVPGEKLRHARHHGRYAYVFTLFFTGMRPSEASYLKLRHADLERGALYVRGSRYRGRDHAMPKTAAAWGTVWLTRENVEVLRPLVPLHPDPEMRLFRDLDGGPIEQERMYDRFCDAERALGITPIRDLYATKDTFASLALTGDPGHGVKPVEKEWLLSQMRISERTFRRHYGRFMHSPERDRYELRKIERGRRRRGPRRAPSAGRMDPGLDPGVEEVRNDREVSEKK